MAIPTYAINLKDRIDRREHIAREFEFRNEFDLRIVEAKEHEYGSIGLWNSIGHIISELVNPSQEFILICEDDHQFTSYYNKELLLRSISLALERKAEILLGGVSWLSSIFNVKDSLFWIESFNGAQFMIIFNQSFNKILEAKFTRNDCADIKISELFCRKFLIYPFISIQKGFGYSDVTPRNADNIFLAKLFIDAEASIKYIVEGEKFYKSMKKRKSESRDYDAYQNLSIRTFIIKSIQRSINELNLSSFKEKKEFDLKILEFDGFLSDFPSQLALLREVIRLGMEEDNDVIIYCSSELIFSDQYNKSVLITCIIDAYSMGINLIYGDELGDFNHAVPLSKYLLWVDHYSSLKFTIIFRSVFDLILHESIEGDNSLADFLSRLSSNKSVISAPMFQEKQSLSKCRLKMIQDNYEKLVCD